MASIPGRIPGSARASPQRPELAHNAGSRAGTVRSPQGQRNYASDMLMIDILDAQQENPNSYRNLNLGVGPGRFPWKDLQELYRANPQGVKTALALCNGRYNYVRNAFEVIFSDMTAAQLQQEPPAGLVGPWKLRRMLLKQKEQKDALRSSGSHLQGASSSQQPLAQGSYTLLNRTLVLHILQAQQRDPTLFSDAHLGKGRDGRNRFTWEDLQVLYQANPQGVQHALSSGSGDNLSVRQAFDTRLPFMTDAELQKEPRGGLRGPWRLHKMLIQQKQQRDAARSRRSSQANSPR